MDDKHCGCCLLAYGMMLPQKPITWQGKFLVEKVCWILLQYVHNVEDNTCIGETLSFYPCLRRLSLLGDTPERFTCQPQPVLRPRLSAKLQGKVLHYIQDSQSLLLLLKTLILLSSWDPARPPLSIRQNSPYPAFGLSFLDWCQCTLTLVMCWPCLDLRPLSAN